MEVSKLMMIDRHVSKIFELPHRTLELSLKIEDNRWKLETSLLSPQLLNLCLL